MRKLLILFLLLYIISPMVGQDRRPENERHRLVAYAQQFLVDQGFDPKKVQLRYEKVTKNIVFLNNPETRVFIMLAREHAAPYLHNRVLAFSMGSTWAEGVDDRGIENFFQYYDSTVAKMRKGDILAESATKHLTPEKNVGSLLKYVKWRQFRVDPHGPMTLPGSWTGCGPTAAAMLMKYHQYPKEIIDWSKTEPKYPYPTGDTTFITPLLLRIGEAVHAHYGVKGTSSSMENIHEAMVCDFGYSSRMHHAYYQMSEREMLQEVRQDLANDRPSMMCGLDHIFLCDGVCGDFYHLNMGWGGNYDGWYRFITPLAMSNQGSMLDGVLTNISPCDAIDSLQHHFVLQAPGQLAQMSPDTLRNIVHLKLTGPINGADLSVLRHMAGNIFNDTIRTWHGALCDLDLSDAQIVAGNAYYYHYDAAFARFWSRWKGKEYHFDRITSSQWEEVKDTRAAHNDAFDICLEDDGRYIVYLKTRDDVVGQSLFAYCRNLRWVKIPRTTKRIERYAFSVCPMLESVTLPDVTTMNNEATALPENCKLLNY